MPYQLQLCDHAVKPYLAEMPLSREGRLCILANLYAQLRDNGDHYINDPTMQIGGGHFQYDFYFLDAGTGKLHRLLVVVDAAPAKYGVLRVVYVEDLAS